MDKAALRRFETKILSIAPFSHSTQKGWRREGFFNPEVFASGRRHNSVHMISFTSKN